jgi:hypothetical protein
LQGSPDETVEITHHLDPEGRCHRGLGRPGLALIAVPAQCSRGRSVRVTVGTSSGHVALTIDPGSGGIAVSSS